METATFRDSLTKCLKQGVQLIINCILEKKMMALFLLSCKIMHAIGMHIPESAIASKQLSTSSSVLFIAKKKKKN